MPNKTKMIISRPILETILSQLQQHMRSYW